MPHYCEQRWLKLFSSWLLLLLLSLLLLHAADAKRSNANLTACQHLRRAESRRAKAIGSEKQVRIPRCRKTGEFEAIQCSNERAGEDCWCIDEYGVELPGTRNANRTQVQCQEPAHCAASACRMFCPSGFARDAQTGCSVCRCRDPCDGLDCPNGQSCQLQDVKCKSEPCPPVPTCKKARNLANYCPAGLPLAIEDSVKPFLCGQDSGKPQCPPLYQCMVESGNDYGVCCPSALTFQKPGVCPSPEQSRFTERTGFMCGSPCSHDLECPSMEKCCFTKGCQYNCQQASNVTGCQQAKALSDVLAINEREGRGYVPDCNGPGGQYSPRQCSRNGLVCWCVDPRTGHKIKESMGAANSVNCDGWENMISRSYGRSFQMEQCDTNICAAVCEYGFKNDHNGCPTCECSEPCEGFKCAMGSHCEVATDPLCESGSSLCASWPVCKPDLAYSNPCDVGTPLSDTVSGEVMYCFEERQARSFQPTAFFEPEAESKQGRAMSNHIMCPEQYKCTKLHRETESVCCPLPEQITAAEDQQATRQQTMCEYLRDFSERMEGTEAGMQLAMPAPRCTEEGDYAGRQCQLRKIKVTRAEQRQILEENTIRRMRMLLSNAPSVSHKRNKRETERLKLYRVDDSALRVQVAPAMSMGRSAKVIDMGAERQQGLGQLFETDLKKVAAATKRPIGESSDLVEMEVEQCWCVDSFGTEIPKSRGYNVSDASCQQLREDLDCLDLTCRMGCEYGFALDTNTRCPACQCRDPCEGVTCGDGKECRIVDVSCEGEYCPPVPACLPRKPGQCPYLVPPGPTDNLDSNICSYECRTDAHCEGSRRCCSNGCGTQCVEPQLKTACQHLQSIQLHQSSELGIPARQMTVAQCDPASGKWEQVQCSPDGYCWCVDSHGQQLAGTRVKSPATPICRANSSFSCPETKCNVSCETGYQVDSNGCSTCSCRNYCDELNCASDEECQLISVECVDSPCPKMPICVPKRASVCAEGNPLQQGDLDVSCGPHNEHEACPTTHTCQLNPVSNRGVCCSKTRDVCFESMDNVCLASSGSEHNSTRYRFSPKANKCLPVTIDTKAAACQTKNLFHNELACNSVCPVLTQCERLKLKNSLAAQRSGHSSVWFQPRCDPVTGHWSPVQCLGKQPALPSTPRTTEIVSRAFAGASSQPAEEEIPNPYGVCWCADRKGAPLKGSLTRDIEPICNSRQARNRKNYDLGDPLMEQLIGQLTQLNDIANEDLDLDEVDARLTTTTTATTTTVASVTERVMAGLANSLLDSQLSVETSPMQLNTTRCRAMAETATFPVDCDEAGAFRPLQCSGKSCWCVDAAGNQLQATHIFGRGDKRCDHVPIEAVSIELHMTNKSSGSSVRNVYDAIRRELLQLLGDVVENLRVQENFDGSVIVRFELHNEAKVDMAFAIETAIASGGFQLVGGHFRPDLTRSHFVHRAAAPPVAQAATAPDQSVQLAMFVMASCSAFLVSIFVVYVMLKRGWHKTLKKNAYDYPKCVPASYEKPLEYSLPSFSLDDIEPESIKYGKA